MLGWEDSGVGTLSANCQRRVCSSPVPTIRLLGDNVGGGWEKPKYPYTCKKCRNGVRDIKSTREKPMSGHTRTIVCASKSPQPIEPKNVFEVIEESFCSLPQSVPRILELGRNRDFGTEYSTPELVWVFLVMCLFPYAYQKCSRMAMLTFHYHCVFVCLRL